jgi:hypothetical protein
MKKFALKTEVVCGERAAQQFNGRGGEIESKSASFLKRSENPEFS